MAGLLEDLIGLPGEQLTESLLDEICKVKLQEGFGLDYKQAAERDSLLRTVSAMANTFGGVIVVGINELRPKGAAYGFPGDIVGVDPSDRARVAGWCHALLVPPYDPEIVSVPLAASSDRVVLIIRVEPPPVGPVMFESHVRVRTDDGNRFADWFRLRQLFTETAGTGSGLNELWVSQQDDDLWTSDPRPDLLVRAGAWFSLANPRVRHMISGVARQDLAEGLRQSILNAALLADIAKDHSPWIAEGHSTASNFQLRWKSWPLGGTSVIHPEARIRVEVPPSAHSSGGVMVLIDIVFRLGALRTGLDAAADASPITVALDELAVLLEALVATVTDVVAPRAASLAGTQAGTMVGPLVTIKSQGPINGAIGLSMLQPISDNTPGRGAELTPDPRLRLSHPADRWLQVRSWIEQLLLDNHYPAPAALLASIIPPTPC